MSFFIDKMILLDSSVIIAYFNERDSQHVKAIELISKLLNHKEEIAITDYIFDECATIILAKLKSKNKAVRILEKVKDIPMIKIDWMIFEESWKTFKSQNLNETHLSFTDCSSIVAVKKENMKGLATFDQDFKKVKEIQVVDS